MSPEAQHEATKQVIIAAPSIGALMLAWFDVPMATWYARLGVAFIVLQILYLIRKWWREEREFRKRRRGTAEGARGKR